LLGTVVEINGINFGATTGQVTIGAKKANVTTWTDSLIVVISPSLPPGNYSYHVIIDPIGHAVNE